MKLLFFILALAFSFTASADYVSTDGDVDFTLNGSIADSSAYFAIIEEGGISGISLLAGTNMMVVVLSPLSGQVMTNPMPAGFSTAEFDIALYYTGVWALADTVTFLGGDTYLFDWAPGTWQGATASLIVSDIAPIPVPAAVWLFGSGLVGMIGIARKRSKV